MVEPRMFLAGAAGLLLSACNPPHEVHEVAGVNSGFCLPKRYVVERIPWVPQSTPEGSGFAFSGCWSGDLKEDSGCLLPKAVIGGVVESTTAFRGQRWQDVGDGSPTKWIVEGADVAFEIEDDGRIVVVSNAKKYWGWLVWRRDRASMKAELEAEDKLIASCQKKDVALPGTTATRLAILCERRVLGKDYALSYSFESEGRVPGDMENLDAQLFAGIDRWRCKK